MWFGVVSRHIYLEILLYDFLETFQIVAISQIWHYLAPKVHKRCTRGAREVHERCTRGAREGHERGRRGAFVGTKGDTVFFILTRLGHGWDTVGTRGHWRHRCTRGAREGHERCTRGAREGHKRGTRGAREGHERCTRGASLNFPTTVFPDICIMSWYQILYSLVQKVKLTRLFQQ